MAESYSITSLTDTGSGLDSRASIPAYNPLVAVEYGSAQDGDTAPAFTFRNTVSTDQQTYGGGKCIQLLTLPSNPGVFCGGHGYGGRHTTPVLIPLGNTIWLRIRAYFPSALSFGYTYGSGAPTTPEADGCGGLSADGSIPAGIKGLMFGENGNTSKSYFNFPNNLRSINSAANSGVMAIESNPSAQQNINVSFARDQWITLEFAVKASNTGNGFARCWYNGTVIAQATNISTVTAGATAINQWGLGDYWNGSPWTDGVAGRDTFYVDDVIVATDVGGYGAPTGEDSSGNPMIGTEITVRDF